MYLFLLYLCVLAILFLPGYLLVINYFRKESDDIDEIIALSFGLSLPFISLLHFICFVLGISLQGGNAAGYLILVGFLLLRTFLKKIRFPSPFTLTMGLFVLFNVYVFLFLTLFSNYTIAYMSDWHKYFPNMALYLHQADPSLYMEGVRVDYLIRRPPLFSLVNSFFMAFTSIQFYYFQVVSTAANTFFFWVIVIILKKFDNKRSVYFALLCLLFVPILSCRPVFTTPKPLIMFFVLLAYYMYVPMRVGVKRNIQWKNLILFGIFFCTAFTAHQMALVYLLWIVMDQIYVCCVKTKRIPWEKMASVFCSFCVMVLPWYIWAVNQFGANRVFVPIPAVSEYYHLSFVNYITTRLAMIFGTLCFPIVDSFVRFVQTEGFQAPLAKSMLVWGNYISRAYLETFLGGFTYVGAIFLLFHWKRWKIASAEMQRLYFLILGGSLTCYLVLLGPDPKGLAFSINAPLVLLYFLFFSSQMSRLTRTVQFVLLSLMVLEYTGARIIMHHVTNFILRYHMLRHPQAPAQYVYQVIHGTFPEATSFLVGTSIVIALFYGFLVIRRLNSLPVD